MAQADGSVLAALVAPHSVDEFLAQYWPEKAFVAHGDPARLPLFLRAPELESIESRPALAIKVSDPNYGERITARLEIPPQSAAALRWLAEREAPFTAGELAARFPALAFAEHQKILKIAAESGLVKMLWFPALAEDRATG